MNGSDIAGDGRYLTDVLTDDAVAFIQRHRPSPFFLLLAYNAPHYPFAGARGRLVAVPR